MENTDKTEGDMELGFGDDNIIAPQNEEQISLDIDGNGDHSTNRWYTDHALHVRFPG
ncbi:MAG: hypothetical protein GDA38_05455 [Hormoscilla sp. SP12CHS1]|nr:hypothetical protein [Hormoscilla sp. SP12CHS1]